MKQSFKDMAQRYVNGENRFVGYVMQSTGTDTATARKVLAYYRKHKLVRIDAVSGDFSVPHGALLDVSSIRKCVDLVTA
jgi:hypothetical protein